jgi:DNA-binding SARP family transcriptional activator/tetratricopeptide (TPR) repeat protein
VGRGGGGGGVGWGGGRGGGGAGGGGGVGGGRGAAGLTQRELAAGSGLSVTAVRDLEQGRSHRPRAGSLAALAGALGLDAGQAAVLARAAGEDARLASAGAGRAAVPGSGLWVAVLGPVVAWRDGVALRLGPPGRRAVLALLALAAGELVRRETVIDVLWEQRPPGTAAELVAAHVSRLRRVLDPAGGDGVLAGAGVAGCRLRAGSGELDVVLFGELARQAGAAAAAGDAAAACGLYEQALSLWRGDPAGDVAVLRGHPAVAELVRRRAEVVAGYAQAAFGLGWHERVIPLLDGLARAEPLNERVHARLMVALAGAGQQAAAVAVYEDLRRRLDEELGVYPGAELAEAHQRVLRQDVPASGPAAGPVATMRTLPRDVPAFTGRDAELRGLVAAAAGAAGVVAIHAVDGMPGVGKTALVTRAAVVDEPGVEPRQELTELQYRILAADPKLLLDGAPADSGRPAAGSDRTIRAGESGRAAPHQLPVGPRHFAGREAELGVLTGLLADVGGPGGAVVISAIGGTAGIGKTALAVHWAHHVADRFPDGQLYVNLRGYDPEESMPAADALAGFLRALGVPGHDIPPEAEERAARYRTLVAGRRILVVLDNARQLEQVRPLLPGSSGCVAVVTSRDALAGLVARDGAVRLDLDLLPLADAVGLLRALIGPRVDADPDTADTLAERCARLPLALRIAAELAAGRPAASLAELAGELADQQQRLDLLDAGGDPRTAVRAVFSWSYRHLDSAAARAFRMLSMHTGTDLDRYAAAALMGTAVERAGRLVGQLSSANLLQPTGPGRHAMHDLLRAYGRELAAADRGNDERRAALTRLFDYYLHTSAAAMNTLFPAEAADRPTIPGPAATALPTTDNRGTARAWLDAERRNYVAAATHAAAQGWPGHATRMAATVFRYLDVGGHMPEAVTIHSHARRAATVIGDHAAEAEALTCLGVAYLRQGLFDQAAGHLHQALRLCRQTGDRGGEARALVDLGLVDLRQGNHERGRGSLQMGAGVYRDIGDRFGEARAMANLGIIERRLGRYRQASECLLRSLAACQAAGDRLSQAPVLTNLGLVDLQLGRYQQAVGHHRQALTLFRETGNRNGEAHALSNLGVAELRWQRYEHAAGHLRQARTLFRETGDTAGEAEALNGLGELLLATGQPGDARAQHAAALVLTGQIGDKYEQARAHDGLARCYHAADDPGRTVRHWQEALALYSYLHAPEAEQVRAHLTAAHDR